MTAPGQAPGRISSNAVRHSLVAILIALFALQVILTSRQSSPAYDEVGKLPAGYVFLKTGHWHIFAEHPPLIHALSALPLLALNPRLDLTDPYLTRQPTNPWNVGLNFLSLNNDDDRLALWHWYRQRSGWFHEVFLLLPALAFVVLISALADPLGLRYLFRSYPLLFIFVSRTASLFTRKTAGAVAGIVLAAWYLSTPIRIYPDYMAYFNELIGGPKHGIDYLDDSNIDWGQNLKRLKH
jgi:hypothetical protein